MFSQPKFLGHLPSTRCRFHLICIHGTGDGSLSQCLLVQKQPIRPIFDVIIIEKQASIKSLIHQNTPRACALGVSQSLPRARGKGALAPPVADKARTPFPQRSKIPRISASPTGFSGTARRTGGPLCVPCGYAVDEVPAKRIKDSVVSGQVGRGTVPCPTQDRVVQLELGRGKRIPQSRRLRETRRDSPL